MNLLFMINNQKTSELTFQKLINKKRIVIVGPADYVNNHDIINNYDIIIRMNKGLKMEKNQKTGSRTDILYHAVNLSEENGGPLTPRSNLHIRFVYPMIKKNEKNSFYLVGTIRDYRKICKNYPNLRNFSILPKKKYLEFESLVCSRPNTGLITILDILSYDIKELYITGFTLFQTDYSKDYREKVDGNKNTGEEARKRMEKIGVHNQKKQSEIFRKIIIEHEKVKYDKELIDSLISLEKKN